MHRPCARARVYVFEFKVVEQAGEGAAMVQLVERGYADKYRGEGAPVHLVGVEFSSASQRGGVRARRGVTTRRGHTRTGAGKAAPGLSRRTVVKSAVLPTVALATPAIHTRAGERTNMTIHDGQLPYLPTTAHAALIRDGELTSEVLTGRYLDRIERFNPALNAVVALADDARERAREADAALAAGRPRGPLQGVPMTIKDCFDTAGVVSTWGTMGRKDFVPGADAAVVARLKAAGAILIGKTNTPEFTLSFETQNKIHRFTNRPAPRWRTTPTTGSAPSSNGRIPARFRAML